MTTKTKTKKVTVTPKNVEKVIGDTIKALDPQIAVDAGRKDAEEKVKQLTSLIALMNDYGFVIEPKIYAQLEEAKKKLV